MGDHLRASCATSPSARNRSRLREAEERYRTWSNRSRPSRTWIDATNPTRSDTAPSMSAPKSRRSWDTRRPSCPRRPTPGSSSSIRTICRRCSPRMNEPRPNWLHWSAEYRMVSRDERMLWVRATAMVLRDAEGRPTQWHGIHLRHHGLERGRRRPCGGARRNSAVPIRPYGSVSSN